MATLMRTLILLIWFSSSIMKADNNGKAMTPPMGWRSWNAFYANINASIIQSQIDELVLTRDASGKPDTSSNNSLLSLGFKSIGIDEGSSNLSSLAFY